MEGGDGKRKMAGGEREREISAGDGWRQEPRPRQTVPGHSRTTTRLRCPASGPKRVGPQRWRYGLTGIPARRRSRRRCLEPTL